MKISNLNFENNVFLAPMAGVTDISFRAVCKDMDCGLVYTEMVSAKALYYGSENTEQLLRISDKESPVAVQIFGNDPLIMAKAAERFNFDDKVCLIDINMGCPAPKIVKNGEGSALMREPKLAHDIVREVRKASIKPVTVKIRKGFNKDEVNAVEFAQTLEEAGAQAIAVHGRTREQMYEGLADWDIIKQVKEKLTVPVIGNGDVFKAEDAINMLSYTNCDGIMIARGSMGNPWLFSQVKEYLKGNGITEPTPEEKIDMCIKHYNLALYYDGEEKAVREMRKHIAWYIKGLKNCTDIKESINYEKSSEKAIDLLKAYKASL